MKKFIRKIWFIAVFAFIIITWLFLEPFMLQVKVVKILHQDIPRSFDGYKIVFLTDIHRGPYFSEERLMKVAKKVNDLKPDLILLGGDYVHRYDIRHLYSCFQVLEKLEAEHGVYAVMGNHDYWMSEEITIQEMKKSGIHLLRNSGVWIQKGEERFFLGGTDDKTAGNPDLQQTVKEAEEQDFTLVVSHHPDVAQEQPLNKVDWLLAGHTHGGQVSLFGIWAPILPTSYGQRFRSGLVHVGDTSVYISNGIGTITPPVRFFARPQILLLTMKMKE